MTLTPAQMTKRTGLNISTLHYYEEIGLLDPIARASNGHRRYTEEDVLRVEFIKHVRATGMSIRQMQRFVALHHLGHKTVNERLAILEEHLQSIESKISALESTRDFLENKIEIVRGLQLHQHPRGEHIFDPIKDKTHQ